MKTVNIIQARMGATRLPGKPLFEVLQRPLLSYQLERLRRCGQIDEIVVATTDHPRDLAIVALCKDEGVPYFCGSEEDVLDRYVQAAQVFEADLIVRGTADCPLIDPAIVDSAVLYFINNFPKYDYVSNALERTYPRGMDVEVFSRRSLLEAGERAQASEEREHVTPYIWRHPEKYRLGNIALEKDLSHLRLTVDTPEDFKLISTILEALYPKNPFFTMDDILKAFEENPDWLKINAHVKQKMI